jgi:2-dehydro-3-deoxygalactonokinase
VEIACIAVDWGTSNRRAWALDGAGLVIDSRHDDQGLVAINAAGGDFAKSFAAFAQGWLSGAPVIMAAMRRARACTTSGSS